MDDIGWEYFPGGLSSRGINNFIVSSGVVAASCDHSIRLSFSGIYKTKILLDWQVIMIRSTGAALVPMVAGSYLYLQQGELLFGIGK